MPSSKIASEPARPIPRHWQLKPLRSRLRRLPRRATPAEQAIALEPANADYHFHLAEDLGAAPRCANKLKAIGLAQRFNQELDIVSTH